MTQLSNVQLYMYLERIEVKRKLMFAIHTKIGKTFTFQPFNKQLYSYLDSEILTKSKSY